MNEKIAKNSFPLLFIAIGTIILSIFIFSCSNPTVNQEVTSITINPQMNNKSLPSSILSLKLEISGYDMDTISENIEVDAEDITLEVPSGEDRTFELTVINPSATFVGATTEDLVAGEAKDITLPLEIETTKIVVPDADYHNGSGRLVQIDDLNGAGWIERDWEDYGFPEITDFIPYDVDFDNSGNIYIANYSPDYGGILKLGHINDTTPQLIINDGRVIALAVDRQNGRIYYLYNTSGDSYELRRCSLDGGNPFSYSDLSLGETFSFSKGVAVDSEGFVYIVCEPGLGDSLPTVYKINPSGTGSIVFPARRSFRDLPSTISSP
jgi:hypothetical protein